MPLTNAVIDPSDVVTSPDPPDGPWSLSPGQAAQTGWSSLEPGAQDTLQSQPVRSTEDDTAATGPASSHNEEATKASPVDGVPASKRVPAARLRTRGKTSAGASSTDAEGSASRARRKLLRARKGKARAIREEDEDEDTTDCEAPPRRTRRVDYAPSDSHQGPSSPTAYGDRPSSSSFSDHPIDVISAEGSETSTDDGSDAEADPPILSSAPVNVARSSPASGPSSAPLPLSPGLSVKSSSHDSSLGEYDGQATGPEELALCVLSRAEDRRYCQLEETPADLVDGMLEETCYRLVEAEGQQLAQAT